MPDLKITEELALKALGVAHDRAQQDLRYRADQLAEELRTAAEVLKNPIKVDVSAADAALVIDFFNNYDGGNGHVQLTLPGGSGNTTEMRAPLPRGRYRALILINRLPEALDTSKR